MKITGYTGWEQSSPGTFNLTGPVPFHEICSGDGSPRLRLDQSALRLLDSVVREGLDSLPGHRSRELGGIILGDVSPDRSIVTLVDVVPIRSEYRFGPTFRPSPVDFEAFSRAINEQSGEQTRVIGYFRSNVGNSIMLRVEDQNLLSGFFTDAGCSI